MYYRSKSFKIDEHRCSVAPCRPPSRLSVRPAACLSALPSVRPFVPSSVRRSVRPVVRPPSVRPSVIRPAARPSSARLSFRPSAHLGLAEALFRTTDCPSFRCPAFGQSFSLFENHENCCVVVQNGPQLVKFGALRRFPSARPLTASSIRFTKFSEPSKITDRQNYIRKLPIYRHRAAVTRTKYTNWMLLFNKTRSQHTV